MKFSITRTKILEGLLKIQNVVSSKNTLQILSNALIKAEDGKLSMTTTDLDMSICHEIEAEVSESGSTTLPIRKLVSIVRELPEDRIAVEIDNKDSASIKCSSSSFIVNGLPVSDFPPIPAPEGARCYRIDQGAFREMLRKTVYAASQDETRRVLNGTLLAFKDGKLTTVATDGRRLALVEHEVEFAPENDIEVILPTKTVSELIHVLGNDGDLQIFVQKNQVVFDMKGTMVCSKLIDGVYPNYRQVIPAGCDERIVIDREGWLTALRRAAIMTDDKSNAVRLTFTDNQLEILCRNSDFGEARELLPIKYVGKEIAVIFNPEYVMDPLKNIDADEVALEITDGGSPALLKCGIPFLYVLMPLRLGS